jgi:hypothetical protein
MTVSSCKNFGKIFCLFNTAFVKMSDSEAIEWCRKRVDENDTTTALAKILFNVWRLLPLDDIILALYCIRRISER